MVTEVRMLTEVNDTNFAQAVAAPRVVVDFWAPWCAPCHDLNRQLATKAPSYSGVLSICKVNVEDSPDTAVKYGVRGLPVLALFKNGELADTRLGALSGARLDDLLKRWAEL